MPVHAYTKTVELYYWTHAHKKYVYGTIIIIIDKIDGVFYCKISQFALIMQLLLCVPADLHVTIESIHYQIARKVNL